MSITNLPVLSMLHTRMHWHQERQRLLAENVANADTPQFRPRDLAPPDFRRDQASAAMVALARTDPAHLGTVSASAAGQFRSQEPERHQARPTGNAVNLEDEMIKVASNQMDYQAAVTLYSRSIGLIKLALSRR